MSNVKGVTTYDASGNIIQSNTATYDTKNRLYKVIGSLNQTSTITYDPNSNVSQIVDGKNHNVNYTYDALNRLASMTAQDGGKTTFTYDSQDNITKINDPSNLNTNYTYDGFDNLIKQVSPDTGTNFYTYDLNGNIVSQTDAKGQVSNYTYDSLDRLINVSYVGQSAEAVTLSYDSCSNGIGKICSITDKTGTINYGYDTNGRLSSKEYLNGSNVSQLKTLLTKRKNKLAKIQANGVIDEIIQYGYNTAGQLTQMTYPSGMVVNYTYNNSNVVSITKTLNGTTESILNNGIYQPFNSDFSSYTWGNGANYTKAFNLDGLISSITTTNSPTTNKSYVYDANYNISNINDPVDSTKNITASYDVVNRLNTYNYGTANTYSYNFNSGGDLNSKVDNTATTNFNYTTGTHQISNLTGAQSDTVQTDANGNITISNGITYTYDAKQRMNSSTDSNLNTTNYLVNYLGQRVEKSNTSTSTYFLYNVNQNLLGEYDLSGNAQNEYIYLNGEPIALVKANTTYYIYDDHLGTPRAITDTSNNLVWEWENSEAFGNNIPNDTVSGTQFTFNLRLPGQYFDNETKLNYNLNRDYNPNWGRYIQSDLIGLAGGINTYGYAYGNSLSYFDYLGLATYLGNSTLMPNKHSIPLGPVGLHNQLPDFFLLTTFESAKKITIQQAVNNGALTRNVTLPIIATALTPNAIGLASSPFCSTATGGLVMVTRWGRSGLEPGDWIMRGNKNYWNYARSFKWEPKWPFLKEEEQNIKASFDTGESFWINEEDIYTPGLKDGLIEGIPKTIFGQKKYIPKQ